MRESDVNQDKEEEYGEEEYESGFLRWMSVIVVLSAVTGFFALAYYAYHTGTQSVSEGELATVTADSGPIKEAPADPGGLEIPHQDKTVYDVISDDGAPPPTAERVLPQPEEPVSVTPPEDTQTWTSNAPAQQAPAPAEKDAKLAGAVSGKQVVEDVPFVESTPEGAVSAKTEEKKVVMVPPGDKEESASAPPAMQPKIIKVEVPDEPLNTGKKDEVTTSVPPKSEMKKVEQPKAEAKKEEAPVKAAASGPAKVQLGAFKSEEEAQSTWKKISKAHYSLIGDHPHNIQRANLGAKGVFYRLQLSGYADAAAAKAACAKFATVKQGCFPVQ